jgi:alpha-glucosidase
MRRTDKTWTSGSVASRFCVIAGILLLVMACLEFERAPRAQGTGAGTAAGAQWWQHAVIYEVYPRSFADSNNDGTGDLRGIAAHLDYLKWLGVDAIWLTPFYPSPQVDSGYDISNYEEVDPRYGTLADYDALVREAKRRHIRVINDMVLAHTSDRHPWFINSRSSRSAADRDFYIWHDGRDDGPPNNWTSWFGGPAWQYDRTTRQYYYHFFYTQQPNLNWRNPAVRKAMFDAARFWLERGAAGFRLDAVATLFADPLLRDNPPGLVKVGDYPEPEQVHVHNMNLPEVHDVLRELHRVGEPYKAVLLGETVGDNEAALSQYYGNGDQIQLPFDFLFMDVNKLSVPEFRKRISAWDHNPAHGTPDWFFDNHDQPRELDRYGDGRHNAAIARMLATLLLTLRGTAIVYYGQEIGMVTTEPKSRDEVRDPVGRRYWPAFKGRDGERTPMQWTPGLNGGFSTVQPWLPVPASSRTINVESERADRQSLLWYYQRLIALRKASSALRAGVWKGLNNDDADVLSYTRSAPGDTVLITLNFENRPEKESYSLPGHTRGRVLLDSAAPNRNFVDLRELHLKPFEAAVIALQ